jgi:hypothetical protein
MQSGTHRQINAPLVAPSLSVSPAGLQPPETLESVKVTSASTFTTFYIGRLFAQALLQNHQ